jgi:hypothetical protein
MEGVSAAAFHGGDPAFRCSGCGRVQSGGSMSITTCKRTQNTHRSDHGYLRGIWPRRDASRRHGWPIWGKSQFLGLWWMAGRGWGCIGFVTRGQSKGNAQFIEVGHGCSEFERDSDHGGDEILLIRRVHHGTHWGKVLWQSLVTLHDSRRRAKMAYGVARLRSSVPPDDIDRSATSQGNPVRSISSRPRPNPPPFRTFYLSQLSTRHRARITALARITARGSPVAGAPHQGSSLGYCTMGSSFSAPDGAIWGAPFSIFYVTTCLSDYIKVDARHTSFNFVVRFLLIHPLDQAQFGSKVDPMLLSV